MRRSGLGRGIEALLKDNEIDEKNDNGIEKTQVRLSDIEPNADQPRHVFDEEKLRELSESIKIHGIIQPLIVRAINGGRYQIIAGERRWRAARMAGLSNAPVVIRDFSDKQVMEIALVENLQREDLNVVEEAKGYKALMDEYNFTQEDVAGRVGKSRPFISNTIRILSLPQKVLELIEKNDISSAQAKLLLSIENADIEKVAFEAAGKKMTVRELEAYIKKINKSIDPDENKTDNNIQKQNINIEFEKTAKNIGEKLGTKINIVNGKKKGKIEIEFYSSDQLTEIMEIISNL